MAAGGLTAALWGRGRPPLAESGGAGESGGSDGAGGSREGRTPTAPDRNRAGGGGTGKAPPPLPALLREGTASCGGRPEASERAAAGADAPLGRALRLGGSPGAVTGCGCGECGRGVFLGEGRARGCGEDAEPEAAVSARGGALLALDSAGSTGRFGRGPEDALRLRKQHGASPTGGGWAGTWGRQLSTCGAQEGAPPASARNGGRIPAGGVAKPCPPQNVKPRSLPPTYTVCWAIKKSPEILKDCAFA